MNPFCENEGIVRWGLVIPLGNGQVTRSVRIVVSTPGFHPGNRSSILLPSTFLLVLEMVDKHD